MATERKLRNVWLFPMEWVDGTLRRQPMFGAISYASYAELPEWLMERVAVLRLLDEREESPLGAWKRDMWGHVYEDHDYWIVLQPDDPEWKEV